MLKLIEIELWQLQSLKLNCLDIDLNDEPFVNATSMIRKMTDVEDEAVGANGGGDAAGQFP